MSPGNRGSEKQFRHLASLERKTTVAKDGITKMSDVVKQKKEQAKVAMAAKKKALDSIAAELSRITLC